MFCYVLSLYVLFVYFERLTSWSSFICSYIIELERFYKVQVLVRFSQYHGHVTSLDMFDHIFYFILLLRGNSTTESHIYNTIPKY